MSVWYTSDEHYGHANVIGFCARPFRDVDHMREELIRRHNEVVGQDDEVWHLGDFSMNPAAVSALLRRLNGRHVLVAGNHDRCHPVHKRSERWKRFYLRAGFRDVYESCFVPGLGPTVWKAQHLPPSNYEDARYLDRRATLQDCDVLLHGHVHEKWKCRTVEVPMGNQRLSDELLPTRKVVLLNVGVDVWDHRPVSNADLREVVGAAFNISAI